MKLDNIWNDPVGKNIKEQINSVEKEILNKAEKICKKFYEDLPSAEKLKLDLDVTESLARQHFD